MKPTQLGRWEGIVIALFAVAGALARLWDAPQLGLNHFDEGIYAASGLWSLSPDGLRGLDPGLIPYAPPGLAILIGWSHRLWGVSDFAAIFPSILAGSATVAMAGWLAQRLFGAGIGAGALTSALFAFWGPHWIFSRMALTDALFLMAWTIGMAASIRFVERPGWRSAIGLGLAVGFAQNVKYNGWLTGWIAALALIASVLRSGPERGTRKAAVQALAMLAMAALIAAMAYAPWIGFVEWKGGGYANLLRHHSRYVDGLAAWPRNLGSQLRQAEALAQSWPLRIVGFLGAAAVLLVWGRRMNSGMARLGAAMAVSGLVLLTPGGLGVGTWCAGGAWIALSMRRGSPHRRAQLVLAGWWLTMTALTPLYHPYARLWLPLGEAGLIAFAGLVAEILRPHPDRNPNAPNALGGTDRRAWIGAGGAIAFCAGLAIATMPAHERFESPPLASASDGLRTAVSELNARLPRQPRPLLVLARPSVAANLALLGRAPGRLESLDSALSSDPGAWLVVDSVQARQDPDWRSKLDRLRRDRPLVGEWQAPVPIVTLLDIDPAAAWRASDAAPCTLWLFGSP